MMTAFEAGGSAAAAFFQIADPDPRRTENAPPAGARAGDLAGRDVCRKHPCTRRRVAFNGATRFFPGQLLVGEAILGRIHFGGPLTGLDGAPETMLIVPRAGGPDEAAAFMTGEPYNRSGVFSRITVRPWVHILPETQPAAIAQAIAAERAQFARLKPIILENA